MRTRRELTRGLELFDSSSAITLIITGWLAFMGGVLLWGGALALGAFCFFASGMNFSRCLLHSKAKSGSFNKINPTYLAHSHLCQSS